MSPSLIKHLERRGIQVKLKISPQICYVTLLIEPSSMNKVCLVKFPSVVTLDT